MKKLKKKQNKKQKKPKIKLLEEKIKKLNNENTTLRENIFTQLKIIEILSGNKEKRLILPSRSKIKTLRRTKKNNDSNTNHSNWQTAHFTKNSNKRGSNDIHFETSNKFAPLLMENVDDLTTYKLTNISSAIQRLVQIVKVTVLTMSLFRQF